MPKSKENTGSELISSKLKLPSSRPTYAGDLEKVAAWVSKLTQQSPQTVKERLRREFEQIGSNVADALYEKKIEPYKWSDELADFYSTTDAFLYELIIWNLNRRKQRMRRQVGKFLYKNIGKQLDILSIGDGLGVDSAYLAAAGHRVTYFELPGYTQSFAEKLFQESNVKVNMISDPSKIPAESFDAVMCLDVLEHVENPPDFVKNIAGYLKTGGCLVVHAPFYQIRFNNPTHLKKNRKYSGSLRLYEKNGFKLIGGEPAWNPIYLKKVRAGEQVCSQLRPELLAVRFAGLYLSLGRVTVLPFLWLNNYVAKGRRWFGE